MLFSGQWRDPWLWLYVGAWSAFGLVALLSIDEDLARERFHPPEHGADRRALRAIRMLAVAYLVLGPIDAGRWHLLGPVPPVARATGLLGMIAFSLLIARAMRANRFFSPVVRIQTERGHHVIGDGPYGWIRHPGYAGMIGAIPLSALALGSWVGLAIALVYSTLIVRRVAFEDGFLRAHLPGYEAYAAKVRYRLLPGLW